jgi:hypothetical protein
MKATDLPKAQEKVKELFDDIKATPEFDRRPMTWNQLNAIRLKTMKRKETWQNVVRIVILNFLTKTVSDEDPFLPKSVISFLEL